jgi:Flp pilus assembly protein CpaB
MAQSSRSSLLPSAGVLLAAVICGGVAAFLVNIHISREIAKYSRGALYVLQFREEVAAGDTIRERHLKVTDVPAAFRDAFRQALKRGDEQLVVGRRAPRRMRQDEIVFGPDFVGDERSLTDTITVRKGYELVVIPADKDTSLGSQLLPGSYVTVSAELYVDEAHKMKNTFEVIRNVQVRTIDGSVQPLPKDRRASYETVGIELKPSQVRQLLQIRNAMVSKRFMLTLPPQPEQAYGADPEVNPEVLRVLQKTMPGMGTVGPG